MFYLKRITEKEELFKVSQLQLRNSDIVEFVGATGKPWKIAYAESLKLSDILWGGYDTKTDELLCAGGCVITSNMLIPWFAGNEKSNQEFLGWTRRGIELVNLWKTFNLPLSNFVWSNNTETIRWLELIGFTVDKSEIYTFNFDITFYQFYINQTGEMNNV